MWAAAGQESEAINESVRGEAPCILRHAQMATGDEEATAPESLQTSDTAQYVKWLALVLQHLLRSRSHTSTFKKCSWSVECFWPHTRSVMLLGLSFCTGRREEWTNKNLDRFLFCVLQLRSGSRDILLQLAPNGTDPSPEGAPFTASPPWVVFKFLAHVRNCCEPRVNNGILSDSEFACKFVDIVEAGACNWRKVRAKV